LGSNEPRESHAESCPCIREPQNSGGPNRPSAFVSSLLSGYRQGDVVGVKTIPLQGQSASRTKRFLASRGVGVSVRGHECPHGVVLISQTCDIVLPNRFTVQVAPLVYLPERMADEARDGKRPRYVHVPNFGEYAFADLAAIATIEKDELVDLSHAHGATSDMEVRDFGRRVARRFGRFAFPDEVVPWLRPLEEVVQKKHDRNSAEGFALRQVRQLRVECPAGWTTGAPYNLTLCIIPRFDALPSLAFADDSDDLQEIPISREVRQWLYNDDMTPKATADRIAREIQRSEAAPEDLHWLWLALAQSWAQKCTPARRDQTPEVMRAVELIDADAVPEDRYSLLRHRHSEELDLDHLSAPPPV
jgi:hypothetical protein